MSERHVGGGVSRYPSDLSDAEGALLMVGIPPPNRISVAWAMGLLRVVRSRAPGRPCIARGVVMAPGNGSREWVRLHAGRDPPPRHHRSSIGQRDAPIGWSQDNRGVQTPHFARYAGSVVVVPAATGSDPDGSSMRLAIPGRTGGPLKGPRERSRRGPPRSGFSPVATTRPLCPLPEGDDTGLRVLPRRRVGSPGGAAPVA